MNPASPHRKRRAGAGSPRAKPGGPFPLNPNPNPKAGLGLRLGLGLGTQSRGGDGDFSLGRRASGVLLHPTSLPGPDGCGDLGPAAHHFIDDLADAGQSWWQMLPVGPPGRAPGFSPYDSASAFAGSPWLVSLSELVRQGWLPARELAPAKGLSAREVRFPATQRHREERLRRAFAGFRRRRGERSRAFREFCDREAGWLEDFALFMALRREAGGRAWTDWEPGLRRRVPSALRAARARLAEEIAGHRFVQFEFDRQWRALRAHARRRGVGLIGDLPIFTGHDSADVWSHPGLFQLDRAGRPARITGYPPDRFNRHGQRWGHPHYSWARHRATGFDWWVGRFRRVFEMFDAVRVDHFLGFTRAWSIPAGARDARAGRWVPSPGFELFAAVERRLGSHPMIAEDLGHVTPADLRLRDAFGLLPMRIFLFGFGSEPDTAQHLPHAWPPGTAAYPGNHDTDTLGGWFHSLSARQRRRVLAYTGGNPATPVRSILRAVMASAANLVIVPMQDVLELDGRARMNVPGTLEGNWRWRVPPGRWTAAGRRLRALAATFGRAPTSTT